jgi:integrator complex subunit 4
MHAVRSAAIRAIRRLAVSCPPLAEAALDFLVDMFNDEIDSVRLAAIHALQSLATHLQLREEQLDLMLSILEDNSHPIREATHRLLGRSRVANYMCLHGVVISLMNNMGKYPADFDSIWR